jgi:8-oxo-dGTP diphosphatase
MSDPADPSDRTVHPPIAVVCGLLEKDDLLLVAQRSHGPLAGRWEFPGGKLQTGEDPAQALRREWLEELGCEIEVLSSMGSLRHHYPWVCIELQAFHARMPQGGASPRALEHQALLWVSAAEILHLDLADADLPFARQWAASKQRSGRPDA